MVSSPPAAPRSDLSGLYFDQQLFSSSVHAGLGCEDCHPGLGRLPHPASLPDPQCDSCHAAQADRYSRGVHGRELDEGHAQAPRCWDCHGSHRILPPTKRDSWTYPLNILTVCSSCHKEHGIAPDVEATGRDLVEYYVDSVHGRAVSESGLIVAATCVDCHGAHQVLPSSHPDSPVHRNHVPETCGACHVGISEVYGESIHSQLRKSGGPAGRGPVCTECHSAHRITRVQTSAFARDIVEECGHCHQDLYSTYRESYHGQVNRLGYRRAARCSDCHGAHDVRAVSDPHSRVSDENRIATCGRCHEGANANFAQFIAHADHRDRRRQPLLFGVWLYFIIAMSGTFTFFGLHSVLWWIRSFIERARNGPSHHEEPGCGRAYVRFRRIHRVTHALVIISFMGLTFTGIPLKFSDQPWALMLATALGGGNVMGIFHRCFAIIMLIYVVIHLGVVIRWARGQRKAGRKGWLFGPDSLLPVGKDLRDLGGMFRWFLGRGVMPKFDRWTYWEKFDYWADAVGTIIIGGSGLILAFPIAASMILPGWFFNVAMIVHGYEALLAVGFIFTMHFFNAHLRVEKFPTDTVIFSGLLSEAEMRAERPLQFERLQREGELDELLRTPRPRWRKTAARIVGVTLLLAGSTLIVLIVWAGLTSFGQG
ncbi:MAG: cytochrome c3 family protein [Phycisphaerales bacterium]|nr:MAG: cytochrome c3 family protein [Phycisphaerales bacterium]